MTLHLEGDRRRNRHKKSVCNLSSEAHPGVSLDCFHQPCLHALSPVRCVPLFEVLPLSLEDLLPMRVSELFAT